MPRKAPDGQGVIEHRITLGNFERAALTTALEKHFKIEQTKAWTQAGSGLGIAVVGVGVCYGAYALGKWLGIGDIFESVLNTPKKLKGALDFIISDRALTALIRQFPAGQQMFERIARDARNAHEEYLKERARLEALYYKYGDPASQYYDQVKADSIEAEITALDEKHALMKEMIDEKIAQVVQAVRDRVPLL